MYNANQSLLNAYCIEREADKTVGFGIISAVLDLKANSQ